MPVIVSKNYMTERERDGEEDWENMNIGMSQA